MNDLAALAMPSLICSIMEGVELESVGAVEVVFVAGSPANLCDCVSHRRSDIGLDTSILIRHDHEEAF